MKDYKIGRKNDRFKANIIDGKLTANSLDHILTKNVKVIAGTRNAAVYDTEGKLVEPYLQSQLYQERLAKRKTASDHLLNAVVFRR